MSQSAVMERPVSVVVPLDADERDGIFARTVGNRTDINVKELTLGEPQAAFARNTKRGECEWIVVQAVRHPRLGVIEVVQI